LGGETMDIKDRIKKIFVELLRVKPEELKEGARLYDSIGVDSTEMVEAVIALEKEFGVKLSPQEITKFSTLEEIEKVVSSKSA
ncbi:MAG: acyl carrier protein, partial [Candidatus Omnitrophica bacterium]|nr:acyl carrier protein [Candidatus Omnitrophota bacterium]